MHLRILAAAATFLFAACSPHDAPTLTAADVLSTAPMPAAVNAASDAPPKILALQLSSVKVPPGSVWSGRIATTTNVASLEVRSPSFTFNAKRTACGEFVFDASALVIPPMFRRPYTVEFVARNTAGAADERDVRVDFR
jgi:hypothetical protein